MQPAVIIADTMDMQVDYLKYLSAIPTFADLHFYLERETSLAEVTKRKWKLMLIDVELPDERILEIAEQALKRDSEPMVILVMDSGQHALEALQMGVLDYLIRPVTEEKLEGMVNKLKKRLELAMVNNL